MRLASSKFFLEYSKVDTIIFLSGVIIISTLTFRYFQFYSTSSLFTDEIYTIENFSSKGPIQVMTDYSVPNNHIFFNLINSVLPFSNSYHPFRARIISLIGFLVFIGVTYKFLHNKGLLIEANVLIALVLASPEMMRMLLEARGYGLLFSINAVISIKSYEYLKSNKSKDLWVIAILGVLGTWIIPSYLFFVICYFIGFLVLSKNTKSVFITGSTTAILIFLAYLPVLKELLAVMSSYANDWGEEFAEGQSIFNLLKLYTPVNTDWQALILFASFNILPFIFTVRGTERKFIIHLFLLIYLCLGAYIFMKTPVLRAATPLIFSFYLILVVTLGGFFVNSRAALVKGLRYTLHFIILIGALFLSFSNKLIPFENWKGAAQFIESNFDKHVEVYCNFRPYSLKKYLDPRYKIVPKFDLIKFQSSQQIYVDSHFFNKSNRSQSFLYDDRKAHITYIPQVRGNYQLIHFYSTKPITNNKDVIKFDSRTLNTDFSGWSGQSYDLPLNKGVFSSMVFDVTSCGQKPPLCQILLQEKNRPAILFATIKLYPEQRRYVLGNEYFKSLDGAKLKNTSKLVIRFKFVETPSCSDIFISNVQVKMN